MKSKINLNYDLVAKCRKHAEAVAKSYPEFFGDMETLGAFLTREEEP